jgi:hypothetical protein
MFFLKQDKILESYRLYLRKIAKIEMKLSTRVELQVIGKTRIFYEFK